MKQKLRFLIVFFVFAPCFFVLEILLLDKFSRAVDFGQKGQTVSVSVLAKEGSIFSANEPEIAVEMKSSVVVGDARPLIMAEYLDKYDSPLLPYSQMIFDVSQKYGLDYRLIVAIAQQESNLCKKMPPNCFNCWGVGIHSRGTMCFSSYPEALEWFAKYLKEEYFDKGYITTEEIMKKYCPLSDGSWSFGVNQFMSELE